MAIDFFQIEWSAPVLLDKAQLQPQVREGVENFLITTLDPKGNHESTKKRVTSEYPLVIINTGKFYKPIEKIMSHNPELLKALSATKPKKKTTSDALW